ncbi:putative DsbA family dithiol-disulfide isomerase [Crossiella equi]|uniref:DsbA family dithiol-disulfide isomerase n=1 Tax=Crossiella equi TaxID=130796 RepID=A0ABS5A6E9_9PSEU|nr:DsbA family oxidoreductase [Crossiella equi]MBP2472169.1 putative DsbA family dithiol-disulfide isomerase [Crossiella equi]
MRVEIWFDVICPWCYLGNARLGHALAGFAHRDEVEVVHRSFELDPSRTPSEVESVERMLAAKYGPGAAEMEQRVAGLARGEGLPFQVGRDVGGTLDVHRLLHLARERGRAHEFTAAAFDTYFGRGQGVFAAADLVRVAEEAGLSTEDARSVLADPEAYLAAVRADEREARRLGVTGVPFVVLDGRLAVPGAQSAEVYGQALAQAWSDV